jgi:hypothetical protein
MGGVHESPVSTVELATAARLSSKIVPHATQMMALTRFSARHVGHVFLGMSAAPSSMDRRVEDGPGWGMAQRAKDLGPLPLCRLCPLCHLCPVAAV